MAIFIKSGDIELAFGISWMPEASSKREHAAFVQKRNPNYAVTCEVAQATRFGVTRRTKIDRQKAKIFAAAYLFAQYLESVASADGGEEGATAILALKIRENDVAIVAILDGQIYRDEVVKAADAEKTIAGLGTETNRSFFPYSNLDILPDAIQFDVSLFEIDEKASGELKPVRNFQKGLIASSLTVALLAAFAFVGYGQYKKTVDADEAAKNRVDPVKAYTESLEQSLSEAGWHGIAVYDSFWLNIASNPVSFAGWEMQNMDCTRLGCHLKWKRLNGSNQDFNSSSQKIKAIYKPDGTIESHLDLKAMPTKLATDALPKSLDFQVLMSSKDQDNKPLADISGIGYVVTPPTIYALPAGTTADQIPPSLAVLSGRITITTRLGIFPEVLRDLPSNVAVSGFNIDLSGGPTGTKVTISGDYFVKP